MRIAISDANIAIDLFNIGAIDIFLSSDLFEIHITDLVLSELHNNFLHDKFLSVTVKSFTPKEISEIYEIKQKCKVSIQDSSCIYYASKLKDAIILSGDRKLGNMARRKFDLEVRGTIFILEELLNNKVISKGECIDYLCKLKEVNPRQPVDVIDGLIRELK